MNYHTQWLLNQLDKGERMKYIFFWGPQPSHHGEITSTSLSQWWQGHPFREDGITYKTTEHYMMASKAKLFEDTEMWDKIIACKNPAEAQKLGRKVRNFDRSVWEMYRCEIVRRGNELKFGQHSDLKKYLLNTKQRVLVEASPHDRIWGIGLDKHHPNAEKPANWRGLNLLGFCLMEVRDLLRES